MCRENVDDESSKFINPGTISAQHYDLDMSARHDVINNYIWITHRKRAHIEYIAIFVVVIDELHYLTRWDTHIAHSHHVAQISPRLPTIVLHSIYYS